MSFVSAPPILVSPKNNINDISSDTKIHPTNKLYNITYKGESCPTAYVVHKILGILSQHTRSLHTLELEKALRNLGFMGVEISTNKELYEALQRVQRIEFDTVTKRLLYRNPFESVNSVETLLSYISANAPIRGLKVTDEMLNANPVMIEWINDVLKQRKVRGIRPTSSHTKGKKKCRHSGTSNQCSIYSSSKCQECFNNVHGLILFPLGKETFEHDRYKLDHDIKNLWDSVTIPPADQLLKEYNISDRISNVPIARNDKRRKGRDDAAKGAKVKMRRIYNTHLFTPQELRRGN